MSLIQSVFPEMMRAMRSLEEPFFHAVRRAPLAAASFPRFEAGFPRIPSVDVVEDEKDFKVYAEMPGISKDNVAINAVNENTLEIRGTLEDEKVVTEPASEEHGKMKKKQHRVLSRERYSEAFYRQVTFPQRVVPEEIQAELKDGLLQITVPKISEKVTSIPIKIK